MAKTMAVELMMGSDGCGEGHGDDEVNRDDGDGNDDGDCDINLHCPLGRTESPGRHIPRVSVSMSPEETREFMPWMWASQSRGLCAILKKKEEPSRASTFASAFFPICPDVREWPHSPAFTLPYHDGLYLLKL